MIHIIRWIFFLNSMLPESELLLNSKGNIYHLDLAPEDVANDIIIVGDPERVKLVSSFFQQIEIEVQNREFCTVTGYFNTKRITVISSGIGTDNIDILLNELDALKNIDLQNRIEKKEKTSLNIVRIGTSGSLQNHIQPGDIVVSKYAIGIDGLLNFYQFNKNDAAHEHLRSHLNWDSNFNPPYIVKANEQLFELFSKDYQKGITVTANGFYAPQGRELRLKLRKSDYLGELRKFSFENLEVTNFEMETSAIYGLSQLLGHNACTICLILVGRTTNNFKQDYQPLMLGLIEDVLDRLTSAY